MLAFVMGTGRCGTTLVQEVLARHDGVGFISGVDDKISRLDLLGTWNRALYRRTPPKDPKMRPLRDSRKMIDRGRVRVAPSEGWNLLDRQVMAGFSRPYRDLLASDLTPYIDQRLHTFFDRRIAAQGCEVFLHHLTGWPRAGLLQAAYPDARFIHVVRDGRAVANSWMQMGWWDGWGGPGNWYLGPLSPSERQRWEESGQSIPVLAALGWSRLLEAAEQARERIPAGQWMDVRYEDVLEAPREKLAEMLDFLGLPWSPAFEAGLNRHRFETGRTVAYRRDLRPADVAAMEQAIAEPLERWGYELEATARLAPVAEMPKQSGKRPARSRQGARA
jgi:hypothetical protein